MATSSGWQCRDDVARQVDPVQVVSEQNMTSSNVTFRDLDHMVPMIWPCCFRSDCWRASTLSAYRMLISTRALGLKVYQEESVTYVFVRCKSTFQSYNEKAGGRP